MSDQNQIMSNESINLKFMVQFPIGFKDLFDFYYGRFL